MELLLLTLVLAVLIVAGTIALVALVRRFRGLQVGLVDALPLTATVVILALLVNLLVSSGASGAAEEIICFCLIIFALAAGAVGLAALVDALLWVPGAKSAIHCGYIRVRPQLLVRRKTNKAIVDHARAITRMNLPLAEGFHLAGRQTPGRTGVVLEAMAEFLLQGLKLSEAYERYRARSALVLSMMRTAERCGQLPAVLGYLQEHLDRDRQLRQRWMPVWWPYPLLMLCMILLVSTFLMYFVLPKFQMIAEDFGMVLPAPTRLAARLGHFGVDYWMLWFGLAAMAGVAVVVRILPRQYPRPGVLSRLGDRVVWLTPGWGKKRQSTDLAHAAAIMSLGLGSGMTMIEAVGCAADLDINIVLRERFARMRELLQRGEAPEQAGRTIHLPKRFLWALRSGQDSENIRSSLGLVERYYSLVASHWVLAVNATVWPVTVLGLGVLVGLIAMAFFMPLVEMINAASVW